MLSKVNVKLQVKKVKKDTRIQDGKVVLKIPNYAGMILRLDNLTNGSS